ncbi:MAG: pseudouridine synthase [Clostridiales bacterium]|nr:pseudouridine synthase [Clostridiales bacterium]
MANDNTAVRINKYLAQCGVCSRRDADIMIERGVVMINGNIALPGMKVTDKDKISVKGKTVTPNDKNVILAYYKPVGVVCTKRDRHAKVKIQDNLKYPIRLNYAGRLDKDSEGLLIMTNDGSLIEAMMRGENRHEKEYLVKVNKPLTDEAIECMKKGVYLKELDTTTRECEITRLGAETMQIVLTQGLNRQIRRMCRAVGYEAKKIKRTRVMTVNLAELKPGEYRELTEEEKKILYKECSLKP